VGNRRLTLVMLDRIARRYGQPPSFWIYRHDKLSLREKLFALDFDAACERIGDDWERQVAKFNQN
jgi:plasmid maintenance system antidote protein VapI